MTDGTTDLGPVKIRREDAILEVTLDRPKANARLIWPLAR